jgi:hypothetical protein
MKISREQLLRQLESVGPGLGKTTDADQADCFVFDDGRVFTFNNEVACSVECRLGDVKGAVQSNALLGMLRRMTEETISVRQSKSEFQIKSEAKRRWVALRMEAGIMGSPAEEPGKWRKVNAELMEAFRLVWPFASKDDSESELTHVHVNKTFVESCDNHQAIRYRVKTGMRQPILVHRESIRHAVSTGVTEVSESEAWIHFRDSDGLMLSCRRYVEKFPDLGPILEAAGKPLTLPDGLDEAVGCAQVLSSEDSDSNEVVVRLEPGQLLLKSHGPSGKFKEITDASYDGEPLEFSAAPHLLTEVIKRTNVCQVAPGRLIVEGERFKYVNCTNVVEE